MTENQRKKAFLEAQQRWEQLRAETRRATSLEATTEELFGLAPNDRAGRIALALTNFRFFVKYYFPKYADADSADFHVEAAEKILKSQKLIAVLEWCRESSKSVLTNVIIPMWLIAHKELVGMVLVSGNDFTAKVLLGSLQAQLMDNQRFIADFGEQYKYGSWGEGNFVTADGIQFVALGRGGKPRGLRNEEKRPNFVVCDDLDDDEIVQNPKRVARAVKWVRTALLPLNIKKMRLIVAGNRIHKNSILANIVGDVDEGDPKNEAVWHSKVVAYDEVTRIPSWHQRYTIAHFDAIEKEMTYAPFRQEYFHEHTVQGSVFKSEWIQWKPMLPLKEYDMLVLYTDPSFAETGDTKATVLIGAHKREIHIIKVYCRKCSVAEMVRWHFDMYEYITNIRPAKIGAGEAIGGAAVADIYVEGVFNQANMYRTEFENEGDRRGYYLPMRWDDRSKPKKEARIQSITPFFENGSVYFNQAEKANTNMIEAKTQLLAFGEGSTYPDDFPDAVEGNIFYLQQRTQVAKTERRLGSRAPSDNTF